MTKRALCRFCKAPIPLDRREHAERSKQPAAYCQAKNHKQLWQKRRRRLIAKGLSGRELERELDRLAKGMERKRAIAAGIAADYNTIMQENADKVFGISEAERRAPEQEAKNAATSREIDRRFTRAGILAELGGEK